ncbi:hypothetical protein F991_01149 [Acinetobacter sp. CIP-A165]|uniref:hypothetical protein n=1 Tax=Acinetobacter sp. CIP-A165 TaxID=40373 RepID=UPI0002CFB36B|nr:hypothetical protein [Acinetobacter sp. CIP-A165]ENU31060.1 hypothetical protein F991_01149 [Acinetobacter sp. CIP-A165]
MSNIQYVIRQNDFAYNDEFYYLDDATLGKVKSIYDDRQQAEENLKKLVVSEIRKEILGNYSIFNEYHYDEKLIHQLHQFTLERCGQPFLDEKGRHEDYVPAALNDKDTFEFAQRTGIMLYQLIEINIEQPHYVIWLCQEQDYFSGFYGTIVDSQDPNFDDVEWHEKIYAFESDLEEYIYHQPFSTLTDSPELFKKLIQSMPAISYDENEKTITGIDFESFDFIQLKSLNALLKQPLFEIRQVTLEELAKL